MGTIIADDTPTFPACPGYGFRTDPYILVKIIEREGGFERTNRQWSQARRQFDSVPIPDHDLGEVEDILYFWLAVGGMSGSFRFKDFTDYKSCKTYQTPAAGDQPVVLNPDSPGGYRLTKVYAFGALTHVRPIYRPVGETVRIFNETNTEQSDWTLDEATGLVTPGGGFAGTITSWAGEFELLCRFNASFSPEISDKEVLSADVSVIEKRERA